MTPTEDESAKPVITLNFDDNNELDNWIIVNDTVMGGRSRASLGLTEKGLTFEGILSLQNNGGFASIRRVYNGKEWVAGKAIKLSLIGDGRPYQFRIRTNRRVDDYAYVASFNTEKGQVISHTFVESDFTAQFRGRLIRGAPALDFSNIEQLGIMLADKTPGPFALTVTAIEQL
jgi:monofunctional biosynthetic peptidoglycan transglycosylase